MTVSTQSITNNVNRAFTNKKPEASRTDNVREDIPDFGDMLSESNAMHAQEMERKKSEMGDNGDFKIGETKDDKEFRDMMERVTGKKEKPLKNKLEKDDFLNLMVTQLKYQDPTKPADHKDMAQQMAQFNSVEQLVSANKSLEKIAQGQTAMQADKLTDYLGREVTVQGNLLRFDGSKTITQPSFKLPADAGQATVAIKDGQGAVVRQISMGSLGAGDYKVAWDGKDKDGKLMKAGNFTFEVKASSLDGKAIKASTQYTSEVTGVSGLDKGGQLETAAGALKAKDIVAVRKPGSAPVAEEAKQVATEPAAKRQEVTPPNGVKTDKAGGDKGDVKEKAEVAAKQPEQVKPDTEVKQTKPEQKMKQPAMAS